MPPPTQAPAQPTQAPATTSGQAMQNLQGFNQNMQNPLQLLQQQENQLGVGQAQQQVQGLRGAINQTTNLLNQVAPSVMGRTGGSLVTSAQADRQVQNEQQPLSNTLGQQESNYNMANSNYSDLTNRAAGLSNAAYQGELGQQSYLQSIYDTLYKQEQDAQAKAFQEQQAAEAKRQFDAQMAEAQAARRAAGSGGASPSFGGLGGSGGSGSAAAGGGGSWTNVGSIGQMIQSLRQQPGGASKWNWGALANNFAQALRAAGNPGGQLDASGHIKTGSAVDQALNKYFNAGGGAPIQRAGNPGPLGMQNIGNALGAAGRGVGGFLGSIF